MNWGFINSQQVIYTYRYQIKYFKYKIYNRSSEISDDLFLFSKLIEEY